MLRPTGATRIERHTLLLTKTGENVRAKGDVVFEATAPVIFKPEHIMAVAPDLEYPKWYMWLGALRWVGLPLIVRTKVLINWKSHTFTGIQWVWPFRVLQHWLVLRHKRRTLGRILVRSILVDDREGLLVAVPLLNFMGETLLYTNLPPVRSGGYLRVTLGILGSLEPPVPEITLCAVGFAIRGVRYEDMRPGPNTGHR